MKKTETHIESPALGCKVGQAYQIMLNQLAAALREAGLDISTSEYLILRAVYSQEGLQQCEIAEMVGKDKASVCRTVATLENRGLLTTEMVSHKCRRVYSTDLSKEIEPKIAEVAGRRHQALAETISPADPETLSLILDKIINSK